MYSERMTTSETGWLWLVLLCVAAAVFLVLVAPAPGINDHAIERHGEDAWSAYNRWESGQYCCRVYRHLRRNRIYWICGDGAMRDLLITTIGGKPVTVFRAPAIYCEARIAGAEYLGTDGYCP